jgi:ubiquinone/menaquinone biosynthesis C-methylase UbiE
VPTKARPSSADERAEVDYARVAPSYDRRYAARSYTGVDDALARWLAGGPREVLEVGCGTGHWLVRLGARGHAVTGVDASPAMLRRARAAARTAATPGTAGERLAVATAEALPFAAASFDAVVCVNAFHHFPDKPGFLAEAWRVLRAGGRFSSVGMDPHGGVRRWAVYDYFPETREIDRRRFPAPAAIRSSLADAGFVDVSTAEVERMEESVIGRAALASPFLERHGTSQLALLDDASYDEGIRRIEAAVARGEAEGRPEPFAVELSLYATTAAKPARR